MRHALAGRPWSAARLEDELTRELNLTRPAHGVLAVNNQDADHFRSAGQLHVRVLGHGLDVHPGPQNYDHRHGFLFVGSLEADQSPNSDSLRWFQREIAPLLDRYMEQDWHVDIIGRHPPHRLREITDRRLILRGAIDDLVPVYNSARVFLAPTRFAAGVPHKIHEAAAHGVPVVATSILAEQLGWSHEVELLVADSADDFARCAARLYRDPDLWQRLRLSALARVQVDCSLDRFSDAVAWAITGV
jgi:glycosyltransferase involved in cell wall biosynthesis